MSVGETNHTPYGGDDLGPWPEKVYLLHPSIKSFGGMVTNPERREYVLADRIKELERERNDLLSFDDYFRSLCGFKRDGRDSKECLDDFLAELKRQDVIVSFKHLLMVATERNQAEAKLTKAIQTLKWYADFGNHVPQTGQPAITFDMGGRAEDVLRELGEYDD